MSDTSAIVPRFVNGRLGNNLLVFSHALYCSYLYEHPLYYYPFRHSEKLALSRLHPSRVKLRGPFSKRVIARSLSAFTSTRNVKYEIPFAEDGYCRPFTDNGSITPQYSDPEFVRRLRECISPIVPIRSVVPPSGIISVAVHLRTGGTFDSDRSKNRFAHKFLDKSTCLKMVVWLFKHLRQQKLYVHIFTDDHHPKTIIKWFEQHSANKDIQWNIRIDNNTLHPMLSDLFSMPNFDYLIRPNSHFSLFAQVLGDYKLILISKQTHFNPQTKEVMADGFDVYTTEDFLYNGLR
jgi:hypothetical protein